MYIAENSEEISWKAVCNGNQRVKAMFKKHGQPQRVGSEPYAEMHKNIIFPRGLAIGWYGRRDRGKKVRWTVL